MSVSGLSGVGLAQVEAGTDVFVVLRSCSGGGRVPPSLCWDHQWHLAEDTGVTCRTGFCLEQRLPTPGSCRKGGLLLLLVLLLSFAPSPRSSGIAPSLLADPGCFM